MHHLQYKHRVVLPKIVHVKNIPVDFFLIIPGKIFTNINSVTFAEPNPPQNLTVTAVTSNQISVSWAAPDSTQNALFDKYILTWVDAASGRFHSVQVDQMNLSAVIGGLKSDQTYGITVMSVTGEGVESSEKASLTVITGDVARCLGNVKNFVTFYFLKLVDSTPNVLCVVMF